MNSGSPDEIWGDFFSVHHPTPGEVRREILKLHNQSQHKQVIAAIKAALINGQSQPWMYEVLALSMEIEKFPKEDVERVVLSMTDFGEVNFESMIYSAAYLVRFDRQATALKLFRQASRMAPERAEPYELALEHALKLQSGEDIAWAACGILTYDWSRDHAKHHQAAEDALKSQERSLQKSGDEAALKQLHEAAAAARQRDLVVELTWSGSADLDLEVEEPFGSVCSISQPQTQSGGFLLNDGYGPKPEDCQETYVCPLGPSGDYRIRVRQASGKLVGNRATLVITRHQGTAKAAVEKKVLIFENSEASTITSLEDGRRTAPRVVIVARNGKPIADRPVRRPRRDPNVMQAAAEFADSRDGFVVGVVGLQPIIQTVQEGAQLSASAIVSPDRRYVRMALSPTFSTITDVFTFSFFGGNGPNQPAPVGN